MESGQSGRIVIQPPPDWRFLVPGIVLAVSPYVPALHELYEQAGEMGFFAARADMSLLGFSLPELAVMAMGGLLIAIAGVRRKFVFDSSEREWRRDNTFYYLPFWRARWPFEEIVKLTVEVAYARSGMKSRPGPFGSYEKRYELVLVMRRRFEVVLDHGKDRDRLAALAGDIAKLTGAKLA